MQRGETVTPQASEGRHHQNECFGSSGLPAGVCLLHRRGSCGHHTNKREPLWKSVEASLFLLRGTGMQGGDAAQPRPGRAASSSPMMSGGDPPSSSFPITHCSLSLNISCPLACHPALRCLVTSSLLMSARLLSAIKCAATSYLSHGFQSRVRRK